MLGVALVLGGADFHAEVAARAVLGSHLQGVLLALVLGTLVVDGLEGPRGTSEGGGVIDLGPDGGVGADHHTLVALDADAGVPLGDLERNVALLPLGGADRPGAVDGEGTHGEQVALALHHHSADALDELRGLGGHRGGPHAGGGGSGGDGHFVEVGQGLVHGVEVLLDDRITLLAVGLLDGLLDLGDGLLAGQHAGDGEEAGLHDGVDAHAHAGVLGHFVGIDDVELELLAGDGFLDFLGQGRPDGVLAVGGVQQEGGTVHRRLEHLVLLEEAGLVAGDEVGLGHQVGAADGTGAEAQVADGDGTGLLGVIDEVALAEVGGLLGDDLDGVLVGTHGAVSAQAVEEGAGHIGGLHIEAGVVGQGGVADVVHDADGEAVLRLVLLQVLVHGLDHGRGELLGGEAVAATHDLGVEGGVALLPALVQGGDDFQVHGLGGGTRLLAAVQHGQLLDGGGQGADELGDGEGPEQADLQDADLLALLEGVLDVLVGGVAAGAHDDDHALGLGVPVVVVEAVVAAGEGAEAVHLLLHDGGAGGVVGIAGLAGLEEGVRILGRAADHRGVGGQGQGAELGHELVRHHVAEVRVVEDLDLGDLVAGAEAVEEVQEGDAGLQGRGVADGGEVMGLLHALGAQHGEAGHAAGHHVRVVAEDAQGVGGQGAGTDVHAEGRQLTGDLVHVRDHQEQALGRREGRGEAAGLEGAVDRASGAALGLHLDDRGDGLPDVHLPLGAPLIGPLAHVGGGRDGIDGDDLAEAMGHRGGGLVAIQGLHDALAHGALLPGFSGGPGV